MAAQDLAEIRRTAEIVHQAQGAGSQQSIPLLYKTHKIFFQNKKWYYWLA